MLWRRKELLPLSVIEPHYPIRQTRVLGAIVRMAYSASGPLVTDCFNICFMCWLSIFATTSKCTSICFDCCINSDINNVCFITLLRRRVDKCTLRNSSTTWLNYSSTGGLLRWKGNSKAGAASGINIHHWHLCVNILLHNAAREPDATRNMIH
jgi:hypothetical protein